MSVCPSIHLSVRMEQLGSHLTDFNGIWYLSTFWKCLKNSSSVKICQDLCTFMTVSRRILLRMRNISVKSCRENQTHFSCSINLLLKSCRLWDNVEKYRRARQATYGNMTHAHCMLNSEGCRHTLFVCNTYYFSTQERLRERASVFRL